ncbi:ChrR family anti-sigma-E factor [Sneathiella glossodoripedis]|uniref:ChrR family anti-sigma-E factor n=1 Tax=Sneathiella glossodoripedis TaxID=418853 RepID=UPI000470169E|nr:ChrR family anti-sigma-E factor [Sneathiella glossodoripedis]
MTIRHHLSDDTLLAYANGTLASTLSVVAATHLAICPKCRNQLEFIFAAGAAELEVLEPDFGSGLDLSIIDEITQLPQEASSIKPENLTLQTTDEKQVPKPLRNILPCELDDIPWKRLVPGISHYPLKGFANPDGKGALRLLKISPGMVMVEHSHSGQELTLILRGSYIDEVGRFAQGDLADLDDNLHHQPVADTDQDCICLIATDSPLKFKGFFSRLLQPLIGI